MKLKFTREDTNMTEKVNLSVVTPVDFQPVSNEEIFDNRRGYVTYGKDNLFPQHLYDLYLNSALFESIIKGEQDYVLGNGIIINQKITNFSSKVNKEFETLQDIVSKAVFDYLLFDGFAIQVFKNEQGEITELYKLDFDNCRVSNDGNSVIYSKQWGTYTKGKSITLPMYDPSKKQRNSIFYFKGSSTRQSNVYPIPSYMGALNDLQSSVEISKFQLNSILNGFNSSCIINFNSGEVDDDTKKRVERKFQEKFCGADNANRIMLNFNENAETAIKVERLQSDDFADRYRALMTDIIKNIFVSFRAMPQLFGFVIEGSLFNREEYTEAATLYQKTVINPIQRTVERAFSKIFNEVDAIKFIPFTLERKEENNG